MTAMPSSEELTDAATELVNFAWSAVTADCDESREYLNSLVDNLRSALARLHPAGEAVAWVNGEVLANIKHTTPVLSANKIGFFDTPLYAHPAPTAADTGGLVERLDIEVRIGAAVRYANRTIKPAKDQPIASCCEGAAAAIVLDALYANGFAVVPAASEQQLAAAREQIAEERARGDRIAADWFDFCDMMGVQPDTQEAVAFSLKATLSSAHETTPATLLSSQEAEIELLKTAAKERNRELTDAHYMTAALVSFLGPSALKVWNRWQSNGVRRVHHDWGPDAAKMTGEERAAFIFDVEDSIEEPDAALTPLPEGGQ